MGKGNVFRPKYRDRHGEVKESRIWWIHYYSDGKLKRENTKTANVAAARKLLTIRQGEIAKGEEPVSPEVNRCKVSELLDLVVNDYKTRGNRTLEKVEERIRLHVEPAFGHMRARLVNGSELQRYVTKRQEEKAANATINRELAILRRGYSLGRKFGMVTMGPEFELLPEHNARQGFFEAQQFEDVLGHLPAYLQPVFRFCFITGWRVHSEVCALEWRQVDFKAGEVRLDAGQTKNKKGRVFPMTADLRALLEAQKAATEALQRELGVVCRYVFHRKGKQIRDFYAAWRTACKKAGCPSRIPHDFRRTAVRALTRAGVNQTVAMALTGHKTAEVFRRYDIVSASDLRTAVEQLETFKDVSKTGPKSLDARTAEGSK